MLLTVFFFSALTLASKLTQNVNTLKAFSQINMTSVFDDIATMSSFFSRHYSSSSGQNSAVWLHNRLTNISSENSVNNLKLQRIESKGLLNFIVTICGENHGTVEDRIAVLGAHYDSKSYMMSSFIAAPGADDNASGTACLLAILEALRTTGLRNSVEFHFYAAEESGLLGSDLVFKSYNESHHQVQSVLILDQIGYTGLSPVSSIGVVGEFGSQSDVDFVTSLIQANCDTSFVLTSCGYKCSDSASAFKYGFQSVLVTESELQSINKFVHTPLDTIDRLNFTHIHQFAKLGISYALELANS